MTTWFSADFHLGHANIIKYCNRPFATAGEMDEVILGNLEARVDDGDTLYFLGDLTFSSQLAEIFFERFKNIEIHFIIGNHDNKGVIKLAREHCKSVSPLMDICIEDTPITLCHYAMRVWDKSHFNAWQLYGHSHGTLPPVGKQIDVGVDNFDFFPVSHAGLAELMASRPDNTNYIPPELRDRSKE
ncbi:MAG: phosphoesterase [Candidatus Hodarchaeota archaeon]